MQGGSRPGPIDADQQTRRDIRDTEQTKPDAHPRAYLTKVHSWSLFYDLRRAVPRDCVEDFVTEGLPWVATTERQAARAVLRLVVPHLDLDGVHNPAIEWTTECRRYMGRFQPPQLWSVDCET